MSKSIVGKKSLLLNKIFLDSEQRVTNLYFIQPQTFIFSAAFDFIADSSSSPNPSNAQLPLKTEQLNVWELTKNKKLILYINEFLEFTRSIHFSSDILESSIYQRCIQSLIQHLRWNILQTIFAIHYTLDVSKGSDTALSFL